MPTIADVYASDFGASPLASPSVNAAAINAAIQFAKSCQNANFILGAGVFEIDDTLVFDGDNHGMTMIGTYEGSLSQGSGPGNSVLKWVGGAEPMIRVDTTFHTFHGLSLQNNGAATHGIHATVGGRLWVDRVKFSKPLGGNAFSVASIEIAGGVNYDRISRCEFETGPAIRVSGPGTRLVVEEFMMESTVGSGAFVDVRGGLELLVLRDGTVNYQLAVPTFLDMSNIGTSRVNVCRVENVEFDSSSLPTQLYIARLKNCDGFLFEANQIHGFGNTANTESPITALNSRVTLRNNAGLVSILRPLVRTLDTSSYVYSYESQQTCTNTNGLIDADSQSGNLLYPPINASKVVFIQGDRASAMAYPVYAINLSETGNYTIVPASVTDSSNQGFMTKGQVFTLMFNNMSTGDLGTLTFRSEFVLSTPAFAFPAPGKRASITFQWDGASARELYRQYDPNPSWVTKTAGAALNLWETRVAADATAASMTLTLPRADTAKSGACFTIKKVTAGNAVTINSAAGYPIDGAASLVLTAQWSLARLESDGTQWLLV